MVLGEHTVPPACTVYQSGLTAIQDIAFDDRTGRLYVYELAEDGVLAFEAGFETGMFPPTVLLPIRNIGRRSEQRSELAAGQLFATRRRGSDTTDGST